MRSLLARLTPALHLTRLTTAFSAVANVWFVVLWTHASPQEPRTPNFVELPLWLLLVGAAVNALGLYAFTTALNDVLDRRRDQILNPQRPIPSGRMSLEAGVSLVVLTLVTAVLGATVLGTLAVVLTITVAAAALVYNAAGKFVPGVGLLLLGLIYAGQMVTPNLQIRFVLPVWLVMTHALLVAGAAHVFGRKAPNLSTRAALFAVIGWVFWSGVMLGVGWYRNRGSGGLTPEWVRPEAYAAPAALAVGFIVLVWLRVRALGKGPRVGEKIARYGALWLSLYSAAWLFGQGHTSAGWILAILAGVGALGMSLLREALAMAEHAMDYRR